MNQEQYKALPDEEKAKTITDRQCENCGTLMFRDGHSIGNLHAICPECWVCPDCDDGAV